MAKKDLRETALYVAFEEHEHFDPALPERNLLRAILLSALSDLRKPGEPSRRATDYLMNDDESYIFSFQSICNFLNIDSKQVLIVAGLKPGLRAALLKSNAELMGLHRDAGPDGTTPRSSRQSQR